MTPPPGPAEPSVAFDRHPAAIERHTDEAPVFPAPADHGGFSRITTWSPWIDAAQPEPARTKLPARQAWGATAPLPAPDASPSPAAAPWPRMVAPHPAPARFDPPLPSPVARSPGSSNPALPPLPPGWHPSEPRVEAPVQPTPPKLPATAIPAAVDPPPPPNPPPNPPWPLTAQAAALVEPARRPSPAIRARGDLLWPGAPPPAPFAEALPVADDPWLGEPGDDELLPAPRPPRQDLRRVGLLVAGLLVLVALIGAGLRFLPDLVGVGRSVTAVFNAPMMVVRAAAAGRVVTVAATPGQIVEPKSPLLSIHVSDAVGPERPVLAGVHGMVRSVETVPGADLAAGAPLVRLQDCDRAFLTVPASAALHAGQQVQVKIADIPAVAGTMRASSGIMEPPDALVVGLPPGSVIGSCPVGASATVTPDAG